MEISTAALKELKDKTGAGVVDCKQALTETGGDIAKAVEILKKKGLLKADKKSGRAANEGMVLVKTQGRKGLVLKVNCETDFVAKTEDFKKFSSDVLETVFSKDYEFSASALPEDVETLRRNVIAKLGENILVTDWRFIQAKGELFPYIHLGKVGSIADMEVNAQDENSKQLMKNIAMQITAMNPVAVDVNGIPADKLAEVKNAFAEEAKQTGKPEKVIENIVRGKLEKYYAESVLMEQPYILDEEKKVKAVLEEQAKAGVALKVHSFVRVALQ